jgi:hypothetical protein
LGENIISKTLTADGEIDLSAHAKGIYFIRANYGEQSFIKRIVLE